MIYTLSEIKAKVQPIIKRYNLPALYLFGSYARDTATDESDLDFVVDTAGTKLTSLLPLGELYCDLEDTFQKSIHLITLKFLCKENPTATDLAFHDSVIADMVSLKDNV